MDLFGFSVYWNWDTNLNVINCYVKGGAPARAARSVVVLFPGQRSAFMPASALLPIETVDYTMFDYGRSPLPSSTVYILIRAAFSPECFNNWTRLCVCAGGCPLSDNAGHGVPSHSKSSGRGRAAAVPLDTPLGNLNPKSSNRNLCLTTTPPRILRSDNHYQHRRTKPLS